MTPRSIPRLILVITALMFSCTTAQIDETLNELNDALKNGEAPSTEQVVAGLKEALIKGITTGSSEASEINGYFKNPSIKIPFPPDVQRVEEKLRQIGLGSEVDKFILAMNRGAENAAREAKSIFIDAIRSMTIQDAWGILKGEDDAATQYLIKTTSAQLKASFKPVIEQALNEVNATKYYSDIVTTYNQILFVADVNPDLNDYATDRAVEGLFFLIAKEEEKIRQDPLARTTELLRKVFGAQD